MNILFKPFTLGSITVAMLATIVGCDSSNGMGQTATQAMQAVGLTSPDPSCLIIGLDTSISMDATDKELQQRNIEANVNSLTDGDTVYLLDIGTGGSGNHIAFEQSIELGTNSMINDKAKAEFSQGLDAVVDQLQGQVSGGTRIVDTLYATTPIIASCGGQSKVTNVLLLSDMVESQYDVSNPATFEIFEKVNSNDYDVNVYVSGAGYANDDAATYAANKAAWEQAFATANMDLKAFGKTIVQVQKNDSTS